MLSDPPPQCVGSADPWIPYVSRSDPPQIHHGNGSLAKGNVSWSHEMDPVKNKEYPEIFKQIMEKIKQFLKFSNGYCNFQCFYDPLIPPQNYFWMKKLKTPKQLMAKSVNPILAQGMIYPYVKICSWTLIYQYQGLLSTFLFDISLWSRSVVKGWSIFMSYVVAHFTYIVL